MYYSHPPPPPKAISRVRDASRSGPCSNLGRYGQVAAHIIGTNRADNYELCNTHNTSLFTNKPSVIQTIYQILQSLITLNFSYHNGQALAPVEWFPGDRDYLKTLTRA
jgi:hypothetical protein